MSAGAGAGKRPFEEVSLGARNTAVDLVAQLDPEYFEHLAHLYDEGTFGRSGVLPRKTKEMLMAALCCALRAPRGVRLHTERALLSGAAPREILEAMEVAAIPAGMPGLWMGVETLHEVLAAKGMTIDSEPLQPSG
ncbi:MAG TPA: carboxymuconolactone decarboxylase family protein [Actinocrinis sp.]|jgi:alkylhydroperoxidase/carboxymuconolactone decarboxylase family protein YurZ